MELLQFRLELLKQSERVGGRAGKSGDYAIMVKLAHLVRSVFQNRLSETYLTVPGHDYLPLAADRQYRCPVKHFEYWIADFGLTIA